MLINKKIMNTKKLFDLIYISILNKYNQNLAFTIYTSPKTLLKLNFVPFL